MSRDPDRFFGNGCQLLHNDSDFIPFEDLGLAVVHS